MKYFGMAFAILLVCVTIIVSRAYFITPVSMSAAYTVVGKNTPLHISVYGDSTIMGILTVDDVNTVTPNNPPNLLQKILRETVNPNIIVSSSSRTGASLNDMLRGKGMFTEPFAEALSKDPARIVIENFAINDSIATSPDMYEQQVREFVVTVKKAGKIAVLEEPNPICNSYYDNWSGKLDVFVEIIRKVAADENILSISQYKPIKERENWTAELGGCNHPYGVHPNEALYAFKAQQEAAALIPLLKNTVNFQ